jgi:hypothetical protein
MGNRRRRLPLELLVFGADARRRLSVGDPAEAAARRDSGERPGRMYAISTLGTVKASLIDYAGGDE